MRTKKIIGQCGVDAGCLMVGDPCYFVGKDSEVNKTYTNWTDFIKKQFDETPACRAKHQMKYQAGHSGLGVVVNTVHGDGTYDVEGIYEGETLVEIRIKLK